MLRRRKSDVEGELPAAGVRLISWPSRRGSRHCVRGLHTVKQAASLRRDMREAAPLTPKEFDRLQMWLACMRMICEHAGDPRSNLPLEPKLEELESILSDLLESRIARSRVLRVERCWNWCGNSPPRGRRDAGRRSQQRRRAEIVRFKQDPACRAVPLHRQRQRRTHLQVQARS